MKITNELTVEDTDGNSQTLVVESFRNNDFVVLKHGTSELIIEAQELISAVENAINHGR